MYADIGKSIIECWKQCKKLNEWDFFLNLFNHMQEQEVLTNF